MKITQEQIDKKYPDKIDRQLMALLIAMNPSSATEQRKYLDDYLFNHPNMPQKTETMLSRRIEIQDVTCEYYGQLIKHTVSGSIPRIIYSYERIDGQPGWQIIRTNDQEILISYTYLPAKEIFPYLVNDYVDVIVNKRQRIGSVKNRTFYYHLIRTADRSTNYDFSAVLSLEHSSNNPLLLGSCETIINKSGFNDLNPNKYVIDSCDPSVVVYMQDNNYYAYPIALNHTAIVPYNFSYDVYIKITSNLPGEEKINYLKKNMGAMIDHLDIKNLTGISLENYMKNYINDYLAKLGLSSYTYTADYHIECNDPNIRFYYEPDGSEPIMAQTYKDTLISL